MKQKTQPYHISSLKSRISHLESAFLLLPFLLFNLIGCDQTFQPLQENSTVAFSMFGYLDASADTQVVRITPLQRQVDTPSEKPEMHVILTHIESGKTAIMKDSLLQFYLPGGYSAINASTPMDIDFGQSYQLTAERPDGATSSVLVTIPDDYPTPQVIGNDGGGCYITLVITGVERIADVRYQMRVRITLPPDITFERTLFVPFRDKVYQTSDNEYKVSMYLPNVRSTAREQLVLPATAKSEVLDRYIFIASGGPGWIDYEELRSLDDLVYALPEVVSNVENGVGYVIGIVSKKIPDNTCPD